MTIIVEFSVEGDDFVLGRMLAEFPDLAMEVERVVPVGNRTLPYLWGYGPDLSDFERAMDEDPNVRSLTVLDRIDDSTLYKVQWEDPDRRLVEGLVATNATILEAYGDDDWLFRVRFEDHTDLAAFHDYCVTNEIAYHLDRVYSLADAPETDSTADLTGRQREALVLAVDRGYFRVPRQVSLAELAAELGVSEQSVSERIRRGTHAVLRNALRPGAERAR